MEVVGRYCVRGVSTNVFWGQPELSVGLMISVSIAPFPPFHVGADLPLSRDWMETQTSSRLAS